MASSTHDTHSLPLRNPYQDSPARKLVTVRRIANLHPIRGTNREVATVDGWTVVVRKGEFTTGEFIVFFEIDSFLPASNNKFWNCCTSNVTELDGVEGHVVRSFLSHNIMSQGLIFALNAFPEIFRLAETLQEFMSTREAIDTLLAMNFAGVLGIKKYDTSVHWPADCIGPSPIFFPQPGCERAQNIPHLFSKWGDKRFQITEKLDGVPMTIYRVKDGSSWHKALPRGRNQETHPVFGVCGRYEDYAEDDTSPFWKTAKAQDMFTKISEIGPNIAIQGELCGWDIMENSMGFKEGEHRFFAFDIYEIDHQSWMGIDPFLYWCWRLDIYHAPFLGRTTLSTFANDLNDLLKKAEGNGVLGQGREGLIFRTMDRTFAFKVISNSWLLKYGQDKKCNW